MLIDRRTTIVGGLALACVPAASRPALPDIAASLAALERRSGSKFGIALLDGKDGTLVGHRIDERFTMCSTFKLSLAALALAKIDTGKIKRDAMLPIAKSDPVGH